MKVSSPKNHFLSALFKSTTVFGLMLGIAQAEPQSGYHATLQSRLAFHTSGPRDLASHRYSLEVNQKLRHGRWGMSAGARAYAEGAFATVGRYPSLVREKESSDFVVRDLFVEYRNPSFLFRVGNQQVVWGEAFGFYYADIVNPKDTREFSLGNLSAQRIPSPMANAILFTKAISVQLLWIPKPFFNQTPTRGNDYAFPYDTLANGRTVSVEHPRSAPLAVANGEYGARVSTLIEGYDLSFFALEHFSRSPTYRILSDATDVKFIGEHRRISSYGMTATKDFESFLGKLEWIFTRNKPIDALVTPAVVMGDPLSGYTTEKSDEWTVVLGFDYPGLGKWRLGGQASHRYLSKNIPGSFTPRNSTIFTLFTNGPLIENTVLDALLSYDPQGGSSQLQLSLLTPLTSQIEFTVGAQLMVGHDASTFGRVQRGSRVYAMLRAFFDQGGM